MSVNRVPDTNREIAELRAEIRKLWAALAIRPGPNPPQESQWFTWSGDVDGAKESGPWTAQGNLTITVGTAGFRPGFASSTDVSIDLMINGVTAWTFSLLAGAEHSTEHVRIHVDAGKTIQIYVSGATGGSDFTFMCGYIRDRNPR